VKHKDKDDFAHHEKSAGQNLHCNRHKTLEQTDLQMCTLRKGLTFNNV